MNAMLNDLPDRRRPPVITTDPAAGIIIGLLAAVVGAVVLVGLVAGIWQYWARLAGG
jgi:hypothetical protein